MQRPASSVFPVVRAEFDLARFVAGSTVDGVEYLQSGPRQSGRPVSTPRAVSADARSARRSRDRRRHKRCSAPASVVRRSRPGVRRGAAADNSDRTAHPTHTDTTRSDASSQCANSAMHYPVPVCCQMGVAEKHRESPDSSRSTIAIPLVQLLMLSRMEKTAADQPYPAARGGRVPGPRRLYARSVGITSVVSSPISGRMLAAFGSFACDRVNIAIRTRSPAGPYAMPTSFVLP